MSNVKEVSKVVVILLNLLVVLLIVSFLVIVHLLVDFPVSIAIHATALQPNLDLIH